MNENLIKNISRRYKELFTKRVIYENLWRCLNKEDIKYLVSIGINPFSKTFFQTEEKQNGRKRIV